VEELLTGVHCIPFMDEAIRKRVIKTGDSRIAVIPEGPYLIPLPINENEHS